jgi:iron(III) transport system substrate-binding protein
VLYSSVDDALLRSVVASFEAATRVKVLIVGDTEATKTTGLVERLLAERAGPRADVWWSSEPFGTIRLTREGLLEAYQSESEERLAGGWPAELVGKRDAGGAPAWYGFACRARVMAYDTRDVSPEAAPRALRELTDEKWKGRVGMARPQFGTTRGHMAALAASCGPEALRAWLVAMESNGLRLYDGNSSVVRAIAQGEIDIGLTDTDDVWAAQREGWPIGLSFETPDGPGAGGVPSGLCSRGPMLIPNTVALVKGAPHPVQARALIDFLLGADVENQLARSDSHNLPVGGELPTELAAYSIPGGWRPELTAVADHAVGALAICQEVLGTP